jgi:hypothetical protein
MTGISLDIRLCRFVLHETLLHAPTCMCIMQCRIHVFVPRCSEDEVGPSRGAPLELFHDKPCRLLCMCLQNVRYSDTVDSMVKVMGTLDESDSSP